MLRSALIVGADSTIGSALAVALRKDGVQVYGTTRRQTQGADPCITYLDLATVPDDWHPPAVDCAFLCAAATSIAACATDATGTSRINVEAPIRLAERLATTAARIVFLSTNLVFDGSRPARLATETTCPTTVYGAQKAEAEQRLHALDDDIRVLRLTKVLSSNHALLRGWRATLARKEPIHPFRDVVLSPVAMDETIKALLRVGNAERGGIFQLSGDRDLTYAELAIALGSDARLVEPVDGAASYPAPPPAHTTLDTRSLVELGLPLRTTLETVEVLKQ